jgi:hypothetical protein
MGHNWSQNDLLTKPQEFAISTTEEMQYSWDVSALLGVGETASTPVVRIDRMTSKDSGVTVTPDPVLSTSIVGDIVIAKIDGSALRQDHLYRVVVTVDIEPDRKQSCMTMLKCVA